MAKRGRRVTFHGAFKLKADAVRKERQTPGAFIVGKNVKRQGRRYIVMTENR